MNNHEMVAAIQYLLEEKQSELLTKLEKYQTERSYSRQSAVRVSTLSDEANEIELFIEKARKGYEE